MAEALIGIIGGTGLYRMEGLEGAEEAAIDTPFGSPSDVIVTGTLNGVGCCVPAQARPRSQNPALRASGKSQHYALKSLGVRSVISVSAVGSLREEIRPLDMVVPDQLIDRTAGRPRTFFGEGVAAHVGLAEPFCGGMRDALRLSSGRAGATVHDGGTLVVIEGPQFSTKAESHMYRSWGADIIGMTTLPEARLAREAELCYAVLACSTDYDCWHESEEPVTVEMVVANLMRNTAVSKAILADVISRRPCGRELRLPLCAGKRHSYGQERHPA